MEWLVGEAIFGTVHPAIASRVTAVCLIPQFDGSILSFEWKEAIRAGTSWVRHDHARRPSSNTAIASFARRLKTLSGLTPYEYIAKIWTSEPDRLIVNPFHEMPGLKT